MASKKRQSKLYQNGYFLSGLGLSSILFVVMSSILFSNGYLQFGNSEISQEESYANSLSPRKQGPGWYTPPTPDPNGWDQIAPTLSFIKPIDGNNVDPDSKVKTYYIVPVELSASDNNSISHVAIYVNGVLDGLLYYNSTKYLATARIPNQAGTYVIKAIAYDYNGNPGEATTSVIVPVRGK